MTFLLVVVLVVVVAIIAILVLAILAGRAMNLGDSYPEQPDDDPDDGLPPLPRQLKPRVSEQWRQFTDDDLNDPREGRPRDTSPE
jgi:hypothetical protein